jgi:platelet-activating factor acetylhydrolase
LLGISSEAFMYWEKNWDASMSLMNEASEHGAPAYLLTVKGSVHISQSDFSILYQHVSSFFMKATVHPQRAIDLNVSTSLEFLRLVTPESGGGKSIIARCMTDEKLLETPLLEGMPDDHRPDDQWIAARLRVDHEFRKRLAAGVQRKVKRNFQGGMGTGYTTSDEMWCFYKPSDEELQKWIDEEERGEKRIDEDRATAPDAELQDTNHPAADASLNHERGEKEGGGALRHDDNLDEALRFQKKQKERSGPVKDIYHEDDKDTGGTKDEGEEKKEAAAADKNEKPADTWLGVLPALQNGPGQGSK